MAPQIHLAEAPDGALTYAVPLAPEALPPVRPEELLEAWRLARRAAALRQWGPRRVLLFPRPDGEMTELAIADPDAGCWAEAIDRAAGLDTIGGLALCLRLLALVEVLTRAPSLAALFEVTAEGIEMHPALLAAAAALPLDAAARFDESRLRRLLSRALPESGAPRRIA
ncbi:hypothetical protein JYK14_05895 [Siccirubricoccus sp. KC 17139]|uniref:Uncharacterized protein n=1 Tax=Siccirubricoccus soli TaxID=2899147 RepID=A0ABT1D401_9PROT|nr:hypothetical protein [Siccirubricoccus soli]MCO6415710.1 hypothetical protein [Siccirubricoccus soli]MCP2681842.1 hypothetical protein [Siccirubricoccus soli]